ncbi:MAG: hypothetical protein NC121_04870 [Blautia sp.]|nr:hypothetical protein [Blautia sp.]
MKLSLNQESADALRVLADQMPRAIEQIEDATERLMAVYAQVEGTLGVHEPHFADMLNRLRNAQMMAQTPVLALPMKLNEVANAIEDYIRTNPDSGSYLGN